MVALLIIAAFAQQQCACEMTLETHKPPLVCLRCAKKVDFCNGYGLCIVFVCVTKRWIVATGVISVLCASVCFFLFTVSYEIVYFVVYCLVLGGRGCRTQNTWCHCLCLTERHVALVHRLAGHMIRWLLGRARKISNSKKNKKPKRKTGENKTAAVASMLLQFFLF